MLVRVEWFAVFPGGQVELGGVLILPALLLVAFGLGFLEFGGLLQMPAIQARFLGVKVSELAVVREGRVHVQDGGTSFGSCVYYARFELHPGRTAHWSKVIGWRTKRAKLQRHSKWQPNRRLSTRVSDPPPQPGRRSAT